MPIVSKAQWKKFAVEQPALLHRFQTEAPVKYADLPEHVPPHKRMDKSLPKKAKLPPREFRPS